MPRTVCCALAFVELLVTSQAAAQPMAGAQRGDAPPPASPSHAIPIHPNILLVVVDDFGVDLLGAYGEAPAPPCTPEMDALAAGGLLFRNAWTDPVCSPSRAQILTGRHGFRTGIGENVGVHEDGEGLSLSMLTIPEAISNYETSAVGKWHLSSGWTDSETNPGLLHPLLSGFEYYAGAMSSVSVGTPHGSYTKWLKNVNGVASQVTTYATTDTADDAIARAALMSPPWFLYVAFNAPHIPVHSPPADLCPVGVCPQGFCPDPAGVGDAGQIKAAVEAIDTELGRMLAAIRSIDPNVMIFFIGDNGSDQRVSEPPFEPDHSKNTLYEGGVNVPLIIQGPGVRIGECAALVSSTDLFATVMALAGGTARTEDSVSLLPYMRNPQAAPRRQTVYAERFWPSYDPDSEPFTYTSHIRAVRNAKYKLIRSTYLEDVTTDEFYNLIDDPFERHDLLPAAPGEETDNYNALVAELAALGVQ